MSMGAALYLRAQWDHEEKMAGARTHLEYVLRGGKPVEVELKFDQNGEVFSRRDVIRMDDADIGEWIRVTEAPRGVEKKNQFTMLLGLLLSVTVLPVVLLKLIPELSQYDPLTFTCCAIVGALYGAWCLFIRDKKVSEQEEGRRESVLKRYGFSKKDVWRVDLPSSGFASYVIYPRD